LVLAAEDIQWCICIVRDIRNVAQALEGCQLALFLVVRNQYNPDSAELVHPGFVA
jgi:hypothetical protein